MASLNRFGYALSLAQTLYDIEVDDTDKAEEIGLVAYGHIGNRRTRLYRAVLPVDCATGRVELPCNLYSIESVTEPCVEDWRYTDNEHDYGDLRSFSTEGFVERAKPGAKRDPLYQGGRLVRYEEVSGAIYVHGGPETVSVLYRGEQLDEDGLPYLNDKEALAVAEYIGYVTKYKEALRTNSQTALAFANDLQQKWLFHCDAARVPESMSQNEMDRILDAQTSWGRKTHHFSYKPLM